ncbi:MAG: DoxX family protein [Aureliella sp.]
MNDPTKPRSKAKIVGWVLSGLLTAFMVFSSVGKFSEFDGKAEMFEHLGWSESVMVNIGMVEVAIALLFLVPRTAFIAVILLTAYLGGAIATHVRVNDSFTFPMIICVVYWIALGLRDSRVFKLAFGIPAK